MRLLPQRHRPPIIGHLTALADFLQHLSASCSDDTFVRLVLSSPADAQATAHHHGVTATILPGMAHMLMLEPEWEMAAEALASWLTDAGK